MKTEHANILLDAEVTEDIRRTFQRPDAPALSRDDTAEIAVNLCRYFAVLERWKRGQAGNAQPNVGELPTVDRKGGR